MQKNTRSKKTPLLVLLPVVILLLLHFGLRIYHNDVQPPYVDEGFHITRAMRIWDFAENPGRFSHGKVLVYFWIGLFEGTNTSQTILPVARAAVSLFSVLTGAMLYLFGRHFARHETGLLALFFYAMAPPAIFYDRMALADPLASGLLAITIWRCLIFVKRPTLLQAMIIGLCIGFTTLAKLNTALVVMVPIMLILIYHDWRNDIPLKQQVIALTKRYLPPLIVAGGIVLLMWAPLLIPAAIAHNTDDRFIIVNTTNITRNYAKGDPTTPLHYIARLVPALIEFVSLPGLVMITGTLIVCLLLVRDRPYRQRVLLIVSLWLMVIGLLSVFFTRFVSMRYFQPLFVPGALMIALMATWLYEQVTRRRLLLIGLSLLTGIYLLLWVMPFLQNLYMTPPILPFEQHGKNWQEYRAGYLIADEAIQAATADLNTLPPRATYVTWNLCHMMYFYTDISLNCLPENTPSMTMRRTLDALPQGEKVYLLMTDYVPFWDKIGGAAWDELARYERKRIKRPIYVLEIWRTGD